MVNKPLVRLANSVDNPVSQFPSFPTPVGGKCLQAWMLAGECYLQMQDFDKALQVPSPQKDALMMLKN